MMALWSMLPAGKAACICGLIGRAARPITTGSPNWRFGQCCRPGRPHVSAVSSGGRRDLLYYDRFPQLEHLSNDSRLLSCRLLFPVADFERSEERRVGKSV